MTTLKRFLKDASGAISILFVLLMPLLMLIGGAATDVSLLNAQKRFTQSQADLAALSASRYLPDPVATRQAAREVVLRNDKFGQITLADADIRIGRYDPVSGVFTRAPNQARPEFASAVQVVVPSRFRPFLLSPILSDENIVIRRAAIGVQRGVVAFTLRNRLLSLHTDRAILGRVLGPLGLGLNTEVLGYMGLATTKVSLNNLLGLIAGTEVGLDVFSFNDVLNLQVGRLALLNHLVTLGGLAKIDINPTQVGTGPLTLGQIVGASPGLLGLNAGDILPDIKLNVFDLVMAMAGLAADPKQRLSVELPVNLGKLVNISVSLGLIRPPVIAVGYVGDTPPPKASVAQVDARVLANVLDFGGTGLLTVSLNVAAATATAVPVSLNCSAQAPSDQLAVFSVQTAPAELALRVGLLDSRAGVDPKDMERVSLGGGTQQVAIRLSELGKPVPVRNPLTLSGLLRDTASFLESVRKDLQDQVNKCGGPLGFLLCPLLGLVNLTLSLLLGILGALVNSLGEFLALLGIDEFLQSLLDLLGIGVAQADLILDSYSCGAALAR
ncbi:pilus assembly protein TadG-related protein [Rhodobacter sp. 24-YEA-8]|uniref:pilus assembly protein TadG-related protein n=1 Tax=Rhodobacter sp. 24-YEA-8 TaxID=1884310 RepID=UPI000897CB85|nr:pilus assembly protein TadG-related protein [Rhodobacter sp. 24-YEA-8]SED30430.1 Uncharacterized membrane protein [Rhodobacter sp. 24-YEA-8]